MNVNSVSRDAVHEAVFQRVADADKFGAVCDAGGRCRRLRNCGRVADKVTVKRRVE